MVSVLVAGLSRSSICPRVRRRLPKVSSAVIVSSGGSEERDPVEVDFGGEPVLKCLEFRSTRPERLEEVEEIGWVTRALEDRLGSAPAIACSERRRQAVG